MCIVDVSKLTFFRTLLLDLSQHSDSELLILLDKKKPHCDFAFTELYNRYSDEVYRYCLFLASDKQFAEDIFQDTFVNYLAKKEHKSEVVNVKAYLIRTAKNLFINRKRNVNYSEMIEFDEIISDDLNNYEDMELMDLIFRAVDMLEINFREAFVLRVIEGMSYKEIGEILNISWSGAQSRVVRAKEKILKILSPYINDLKQNK